MEITDTFSDSRSAIDAIGTAYRDDDFRKAWQLCEAAASRYRRSQDVQSVHAYFLLLRGERDRARKTARKAREADPSCALAWGADAYVAAFEDRMDEARESARRALELDPCDPWVLQWCTGVHELACDYDAALALSSQWCERFPDDMQAMSSRIGLLSSSGRREEAEQLLQQAESRFPDCPTFWVIRGRQLAHRDRVNDAIQLLERAVERCPGSANARTTLARAYNSAQDHEAARRMAESALDINPGEASAMGAIGVACGGSAGGGEVGKWLRRASHASPVVCAHPELDEMISLPLMRDHPRMLETADRLSASATPQIRRQALERKVIALLGLKRYDEAAAALDELSAFPNSDQIIAIHRVKLLQGMGQTDETIALMREMIGKRFSVSLYESQLLRLLHGKGASDDECELVAQIMADPPDNPNSLMLLHMALRDTGYTSESQGILRIAIERFPKAQTLRVMGATFSLMDLGAGGMDDTLKGITGPLRLSALMIRFVLWMVKKVAPWMNRRKPGSGDRLMGPLEEHRDADGDRSEK